MFKKGSITLDCGGATYPYFEVKFTKGNTLVLQLTNLSGKPLTKEITEEIINDNDISCIINFYAKSRASYKNRYYQTYVISMMVTGQHWNLILAVYLVLTLIPTRT